MDIKLKFKKNPNGRALTLTQKTPNDSMPVDCRDEFLFSNPDAGSFYRAVARKLHILHCEGHNVEYEDVGY